MFVTHGAFQIAKAEFLRFLRMPIDPQVKAQTAQQAHPPWEGRSGHG